MQLRHSLLLALAALSVLCVVHADEELSYDEYWALVFPAPPASFNPNDAADRAQYLYASPVWVDLAKDPAFMNGIPHTPHTTTSSRVVTSRAATHVSRQASPTLDLNNGCQSAAGVKNADGSVTYCSATIATCTPSPRCTDCPTPRPRCPECAGRDLFFVDASSISPYEAPTPNFVTQRYPLELCPETLMTVPENGTAQAIQKFPLTLAVRAVAPFGSLEIDRTYIVNDKCVNNYAVQRLDQILDNGNDSPLAPRVKPNGDVQCEIWNSSGYLGAIGLESINAPAGVAAACYKKALVPFSFHAKGLVDPDPFSRAGTFNVNKACVQSLKDAYVLSTSTSPCS